MEKKKTKLKLSGNIKKSITNIERAKSQGANSVEIEKKSESKMNCNNCNNSYSGNNCPKCNTINPLLIKKKKKKKKKKK